ncbi:MAG: DUF4339 domain-containing protein [Akkermansiaceae bacterium]|nr:DUF4339 domain-containing protein [Akkermansiaceae bacterium]
MWHFARGGAQEGPVVEDELAGMLRRGTLPPSTLVWREGMGSWQPASEVPALWASVGNVVQPAPGQPAAVGAPTNPLAITSLVLGIVSFVLTTLILTAIPGAICGHIARRQMRDSPHPQAGSGMVTAGLVLNYLAIALTFAVILFIVGIFAWGINSVPSPTGPPPPVVVPTILIGA